MVDVGVDIALDIVAMLLSSLLLLLGAFFLQEMPDFVFTVVTAADKAVVEEEGDEAIIVGIVVDVRNNLFG